MATSLDDALLGPSMLDLIQNTLTRQLTDVAEGFGGMVGMSPDDLVGTGSAFLPAALKGPALSSKQDLHGDREIPATTAIQPLGGESGMGSFTAPICDLFIEVFDLKENNWLRRQAIVVILQQFLGSTIER